MGKKNQVGKFIAIWVAVIVCLMALFYGLHFIQEEIRDYQSPYEIVAAREAYIANVSQVGVADENSCLVFADTSFDFDGELNEFLLNQCGSIDATNLVIRHSIIDGSSYIGGAFCESITGNVIGQGAIYTLREKSTDSLCYVTETR